MEAIRILILMTLLIMTHAHDIVCGFFTDFKSEPILPYSKGSENFDDQPQCSLAYNKKDNIVTLAAAGKLFAL